MSIILPTIGNFLYAIQKGLLLAFSHWLSCSEHGYDTLYDTWYISYDMTWYKPTRHVSQPRNTLGWISGDIICISYSTICIMWYMICWISFCVSLTCSNVMMTSFCVNLTSSAFSSVKLFKTKYPISHLLLP